MMVNRFWIASFAALMFAFSPVVTQAQDEAASASVQDDLDNLEFASGEVAAFDSAAGKLQVKVYLDDAGNPAENTIELGVSSNTEVTNGEKDLDLTAFKPGVEIDVEYNKTSSQATYVFVY